MGDFSVGDAVIINDFDCPETKMVALVRRVQSNGRVRARYLSARTAKNYGQRDCYSDNPTKLSDFGMAVRFIMEPGEVLRYEVQKVGDSTAVYEDGTPRAWQDRSTRAWAVDPNNPVFASLAEGPLPASYP